MRFHSLARRVRRDGTTEPARLRSPEEILHAGHDRQLPHEALVMVLKRLLKGRPLHRRVERAPDIRRLIFMPDGLVEDFSRERSARARMNRGAGVHHCSLRVEDESVEIENERPNCTFRFQNSPLRPSVTAKPHSWTR
jgi:hypothetical protein